MGLWEGPNEGPCPGTFEVYCSPSPLMEVCPEAKDMVSAAAKGLPEGAIIIPGVSIFDPSVEIENRSVVPIFQEATTVYFSTSAGQEYQVQIYDANDVLVFESQRIVPPTPGLQSFMWDGLGNVWEDERIAKARGTYAVVVSIFLGSNPNPMIIQRTIRVSY